MSDETIINAETVIIEDGDSSGESDEWQSEPEALTTADSSPTETSSITESAETVAQAAAEVALASAVIAQETTENDQTNATLETILSEIQDVKLRLAVLETPPQVEVSESDLALETPSSETETATVETVTVETEPVREKNPEPEVSAVPEKRHGRRWRTNLMKKRDRNP